MPVTSQFWMMSTPSASARARVAPGDRVVACGAAAPLQRRAHDRIARGPARVEQRLEPLDLLGRQELAVDPVQPVGMAAAPDLLQVVHGMGEVHHAALAEHDVVVQLLAQALPELDRVVVDPGALVPQVVGADDRGVAPGVAAAEPALLEHRDVGDARAPWRDSRRSQARARRRRRRSPRSAAAARGCATPAPSPPADGTRSAPGQRSSSAACPLGRPRIPLGRRRCLKARRAMQGHGRLGSTSWPDPSWR